MTTKQNVEYRAFTPYCSVLNIPCVQRFRIEGPREARKRASRFNDAMSAEATETTENDRNYGHVYGLVASWPVCVGGDAVNDATDCESGCPIRQSLSAH